MDVIRTGRVDGYEKKTLKGKVRAAPNQQRFGR